MAEHRWTVQLFRYVVVGVTTNAIAYLCYLALTFLGLWPTGAMTIVYVSCALMGFLANRRLTFSHEGNVVSSGARYVMAQALGYVVNTLLLFVFVDRLGYAHAWVQAVAIVVVAPILFMAMKFFVFRRVGEHAPHDP